MEDWTISVTRTLECATAKLASIQMVDAKLVLKVTSGKIAMVNITYPTNIYFSHF